jgi:S-adenosylhomocysteine hydrolase
MTNFENYAEYIDNFLDIRKKLNVIFENGKEIIAFVGRNKHPLPVELVGYNYSTGDIYIRYGTNKNKIKMKRIKAKNIIDNIEKLL